MQLFYELMQVAAGQTDCLSRGPSAREWQELYDTARRHQLVGICYHGVERLFEYGLRAPQDLSIDWMSDAETMRELNEKTLKRCQLLQKRLAEKGIRSAVLYGPGASCPYPAELQSLYQSEGLDLLVDCDAARAVRFVELTGQQQVSRNEVCVFLDKWTDTPVRLFFAIDFPTNPLKRGTIRKWFSQQTALMCQPDTTLSVYSLQLGIVYSLLDLYRSVAKGHATMRQLLDCYFMLRKADGRFVTFKDGKTLGATFKMLGIGRFSQGVMWLLQQSLQLDTRLLACKPVEDEGRYIESQIMHGRNLLSMLRRHPFLTVCNL